MKKMYTAFEFNSDSISYKDIFNASIENDMHSEQILGDRSIIEEKIPGRDIPYLYYVDSAPIEFEVTFALSKPMSAAEIKSLIRKLLSLNNYAPLTFGKYVEGTYVPSTPVYYVIFYGENLFNYIYKNSDDKYDGYFTLNARCNAPYGFYVRNNLQITNNIGVTELNNGDFECLPDITITSSNQINSFILSSHKDNNFNNLEILSDIGFSTLYAGEEITISGDLKTIKTNNSNSIYERWNRNFLKIYPDYNYLKSSHSGVTITINYKSGQSV